MNKSFELAIDESWRADERSFVSCFWSYIGLVYAVGFYGSLIALVAYLVLLIANIPNPLINVIVVGAVLFAAASLWYWILFFKNQRIWDQWLSEHSGEIISFHFKEDCIEQRSPAGTNICHWTHLSSITCGNSNWILTFANDAILFPVQFVDSDIEEFLGSFVVKDQVKVYAQGRVFLTEHSSVPSIQINKNNLPESNQIKSTNDAENI